ncbi:hypothetical protein ONZ45_g10164 [Pleurotus djamor]|nr:hypothetical protein ONZ45_g10164 [Pleurotus djamor]
MPEIIHSLHEENSSVLSLAVSDNHIFSGGQNQHISVWCRKTFQLVKILRAHTGSVLALEYSKEKDWLFSASGDNTVCVWSTQCLDLLYVLETFPESGSGDLFSLAYCPSISTLYIGCQDTSLQWFDFRTLESNDATNDVVPPIPLDREKSAPHHYLRNGAPDSSPASGSGASTPNIRKPHKFFDSYPQHERRPADLYANNNVPNLASLPSLLSQTSLDASRSMSDCVVLDVNPTANAPHLHVPAKNVIDSAHYGYVYCMVLLENEGEIQLITGSGDETVKLWRISASSPEPSLVYTYSCSQGAVLALAAQGETIYAACQDGYVKVLDIDTKACNVDILSLSLLGSDLYTFSASGSIQRWSASFDRTASWRGHDKIILSSRIVPNRTPSWGVLNDTSDDSDTWQLITGGNDEYIKVWDVIPPKTREVKMHAITSKSTIEYALSKFVTFPSLPTKDGHNPLVLATFNGASKTNSKKQRLLFYGHYDVIAAPPQGWNSDPWSLTGRNGYLYGRGVTDDKGPIMAVACAAAELLSKRALGLDLVFLIEGEEECGSIGFSDAVKKYKEQIGEVDAILVSNSTWIAENPPCITYGLRGVVHCTLQISSDLPDLHSGIEGGAVAEPMLDMIRLLATLTDKRNHVQVPGFYDSVRPTTEEEQQLYTRLSALTQRPASSLASKWSEPSLTVHNLQISGPRNATVIPGSVKAQVSVRIVPDQDLDTIAKSLCDYLHASFEELGSPNVLNVSIEHKANWWLGDLDGQWFRSLERAVMDEWGVEPLRIREGGSIPSIPYLEKEFGCGALHLPMGQSTDQAHLPNERISLSNLQRGKAVVERFLLNVAEMT